MDGPVPSRTSGRSLVLSFGIVPPENVPSEIVADEIVPSIPSDNFVMCLQFGMGSVIMSRVESPVGMDAKESRYPLDFDPETWDTDGMNYRALETSLSDSLTGVSYDVLPSRADAERAYGTMRARYGFAATPGAILTSEKGNAKLAKGEGRELIMLALAPSSSSGVAEVCPFSTPGCREFCVAHTGNGGFPAVARARSARTDLLVSHPREFLSLVVRAIDKAAAKAPLAVRLNGFSDIRWERVLPAWFWSRWDNVTFYDYTKHSVASRPMATMPENYVLTYSVTERTTAAKLTRERAAGRNVAIVVDVFGGKDRRTGELRPMPEIPGLIDGDKNDRRFDDPPGSVVGLRRKGGLPSDNGLVVRGARLGELFGC